MNNTDVSFFFYHFTICIAPQLLLKSTFNSSKISGSFSSLFNFQGSIKLSLPKQLAYSITLLTLLSRAFFNFLKFFCDGVRLFSCPLSETVSLFYHLSFPLSTLFLPFFDLFFAFVHPPGCVCGIGSFKVLYVVLHRKSYTIFLYHGINMSAVFR